MAEIIRQFVISEGADMDLIAEFLQGGDCAIDEERRREEFVANLLRQILLVGVISPVQEDLAQKIFRRLINEPRALNFLNDPHLSTYFLNGIFNLTIDGMTTVRGNFFPVFLGALEMSNGLELGKTLAYNLLDRYLIIYGEDHRLWDILKDGETVRRLGAMPFGSSASFRRSRSNFQHTLTMLISFKSRATPPQDISIINEIVALYFGPN